MNRVKKNQTDPDQMTFDDGDEMSTMREALANARAEIAELKRENERLAYAESVLESLKGDEPLAWNQRPALSLLALITLIIGRVYWFVCFEACGTRSWMLGTAASAIFGAAAVALLTVWVKRDWAKESWLIVPHAVIILLGLMPVGVILVGSAIVRPLPQPPTVMEMAWGTAGGIFAILLAASNIPKSAFNIVASFLEHASLPIERKDKK